MILLNNFIVSPWFDTLYIIYQTLFLILLKIRSPLKDQRASDSDVKEPIK